MNSLDLFYPSPIFRREEAREIQSLPLKSGMVPASDDVFNDIKRYRQNACCYFGDAPTLKLFSKSTRSCSLIYTHTHNAHFVDGSSCTCSRRPVLEYPRSKQTILSFGCGKENLDLE